MKKLSKVLKGGVLAAFAVLVFAAPTFAAYDCIGQGEYSGLSKATAKPNGWIYCTTAGTGNNAIKIWGETAADCQKAATLVTNPDQCKGDDLNSIIAIIINTIIFVIGMIAVVMIILGGITYATSQGDPSKVKKGKDTILYGIIGLVVALLAFAIVQFVLNAINQG